jgi:hypothetical protein
MSGDTETKKVIYLADKKGDAVEEKKPELDETEVSKPPATAAEPSEDEKTAMDSIDHDEDDGDDEADQAQAAQTQTQDDDKDSVATSELMSLHPFYLMMERFLKHENKTVAHILADILKELKKSNGSLNDEEKEEEAPPGEGEAKAEAAESEAEAKSSA